jgi:hypothetical protein
MKPSPSNYVYQPLGHESTTSPPTATHGPSPKRRRRIILLSLIAAVITLGFSLIALSLLHLQLLHSTMAPRKLHCGGNVAESKQAGCSFDSLAKAWLPAACPRYGLEQFEAAGLEHNQSRWRYWRDQAGHEELSIEDLASLGKDEKWWGPEREHLTHCAWMLVRKAHALSEGDRLDKLTADFNHSKHCTMLLLWRALQADGIDEMDTSGNVVFGGC